MPAVQGSVVMDFEIHECACHASTDPIHRAVNIRRPRRPVPKAVTFGQFARAGIRHGWSIDFLAKLFRGKIDEPRELFDRIFDRHGRHAAMLVPYASLLSFYWREVTAKPCRRARKNSPGTPVVATSFDAETGEDYPRPESA